MGVDQVETLKHLELRHLQSRRKMCLILDLDHTLLHTNFRHKPNTVSQCHGDDIFEWKYLTKLRPFVRNFLEEANQMFELYVYTMGTRDYASKIVGEFLDPKDIYFGNRIISREDCTVPGLKGLDIVPVHPSAIVILDDTESVWKGYFGNLIVVEKYNYFPQLGLDESDDAGELSFALKVLTKLHSVYFECYDRFMDCDVRELIDNHWEEILNGDGCASGLVFGKRPNDQCSSVTKKQRVC